MRGLIASWKEKYFKKNEEPKKKKVEVKAPILPKTGVPTRDKMREKFHEILLEAA